MRGEVHILVHCPIDTLQWGSTHSAVVVTFVTSTVRFAYWWAIYKVICSDVNCNWWQRWASGSGLHRGARLQPWELEVPSEIISDFIIVQDLI